MKSSAPRISIAQQHSFFIIYKDISTCLLFSCSTQIYFFFFGFFNKSRLTNKQALTLMNYCMHDSFKFYINKNRCSLFLSSVFFSTSISLHFLFSPPWSTIVECANVKRTKRKITKHNCITNVWLHHSFFARENDTAKEK
jgi:hypothetical protein